MKQEDEIDLMELLQKIWDKRKMIIKYSIIGFLLGIFVALTSKKEYTATTSLSIQTSQSGVSSLGGLAALAGINLGGNTSADLTPKLYPNIANSIPFKKKILQTPISIQGLDADISYAEYYQNHAKVGFWGVVKKYTIGLPFTILGWFSSEKKSSDGNKNPLYVVSAEEKGLFGIISSQFLVNVNEKDNLVNLSFTMDEPLAAAQMLTHAKEELQKTITDFKIQKAQDKLNFIEKRYLEAQQDYKTKQMQLANFQDSNRGLMTSMSQTRLTQLQGEYSLAQGIYSELAKQLETQKIQVKEDTPIFTTIEPITVPLEKSKPKTLIVVVIWTFLGFILSIGMIFLKEFLNHFKKEEI